MGGCNPYPTRCRHAGIKPSIERDELELIGKKSCRKTEEHVEVKKGSTENVKIRNTTGKKNRRKQCDSE